MEKTKLRGLLEDLHGELEQAESLEPETRALLRSVMDDIHGVLEKAVLEKTVPEKAVPEKTDSPAEGEALSGRLNQAVVDFENSHPRLSFAVERLVKSLSDIGI